MIRIPNIRSKVFLPRSQVFLPPEVEGEASIFHFFGVTPYVEELSVVSHSFESTEYDMFDYAESSVLEEFGFSGGWQDTSANDSPNPDFDTSESTVVETFDVSSTWDGVP